LASSAVRSFHIIQSGSVYKSSSNILLLIDIRSVLVWNHPKLYTTGSAEKSRFRVYYFVDLWALPSVIYILIGMIFIPIFSVFIFPLSKFWGRNFCKVDGMLHPVPGIRTQIHVLIFDHIFQFFIIFFFGFIIIYTWYQV